MLGRSLGEATRVQALVVAMEQEEITLSEFSDVMGTLTPEAIQVMSSLLRKWSDLDCEEQERLWAARLLCQRMASRMRVLS